MSESNEIETSEDKQFDYLTDVRNLDAKSAHLIIHNERTDDASRRLVGDVVTSPHSNRPAPRYSHRGGRSYPEPSDSERDPYWNSREPDGAMAEDSQVALQALAYQSREALKQFWIAGGLSPTEAEARMIARMSHK